MKFLILISLFASLYLIGCAHPMTKDDCSNQCKMRGLEYDTVIINGIRQGIANSWDVCKCKG